MRTSTRPALLAVLAASVAAASAAPSASAATQRYASPTGTGVACTSAKPCSITEAVKPAYTDDEVIVAPGDYALTQGLDVTGITVHGVAGQPRPRLLFETAPSPSMRVREATLRYLEVDQAPALHGIALQSRQSSVDQVIVRGSAQPNWPAARIESSSMIRNSIVVAPAANGTAIVTEADGAFTGGTFRNVTAIATEVGGVAIRAAAANGGYANVLARNVIARGYSSGHSLEAWTDNKGAKATITVGHSNWLGGLPLGSNASIVDGGGNQSYAPTFVGAAAGDYRQAAGSPTIDAGLAEAINGDFDVEGDPRQIGPIDIGADEFVVAPAASTGLASAVSERSATVSGSVDANGAPTSYHFEYGPTTAYGSVTPAADAGSGGAVPAAAILGALGPGTTYHYRLVATNAGGVTEGADRTFTTLPVQVAPATTTAPVQAFAGVEFVSNRLTYARRSITIRLRCPAGTTGRCSGAAKLTAGKRRVITLGRASLSIAPGSQASVRVRVTRAGRRLLRNTSSLRGRAISAARDGAGQSKTTRAAVTIQRRHR